MSFKARVGSGVLDCGRKQSQNTSQEYSTYIQAEQASSSSLGADSQPVFAVGKSGLGPAVAVDK